MNVENCYYDVVNNNVYAMICKKTLVCQVSYFLPVPKIPDHPMPIFRMKRDAMILVSSCASINLQIRGNNNINNVVVQFFQKDTCHSPEDSLAVIESRLFNRGVLSCFVKPNWEK